MLKAQKENIKKVKDSIAISKRIALFTHNDPDGDAIGSMSSMHHALVEKNKVVYSFLSGNIPANFYHLSLPLFSREKDDQIFDLAIIMDCADINRAGLFKEIFVDGDITIINMDHHPQENPFGDFNIVDTGVSSTSEIVYELLLDMGFYLNKDISNLILMGIMFDTGNFMHSNTSSRTLNIASDLILKGANLKKISQKILRQKRISTLRLWGNVLSRIKGDRKKGIVSSVITNEDLESCGATKEELEGVVNLIASIPESKASLLLREDKEGNVRGSLRSNTDDFDTRKLAKIFGGGGHTRASGFKLKGKIKETKDGWQIIEE